MIQWNAALARRLSCPEDRKAALPALVRTLAGFAQKARTEGIPALQEAARKTDDPFLALGLGLVAEGLSGELLEDILAAHLITGELFGYDFLKACMTAETLVSISQGDAAALTVRKLVAYCGAERASSLLDEFGPVSPYSREIP